MRRLLTAWLLLLIVAAAGLGIVLLAARPALRALDWPAGLAEQAAPPNAAAPRGPDPRSGPRPDALPPYAGRIAFVARGGALGSIASDGTGERLLKVDRDIRFSLPTWSPDASRLAAIGIEGARAGIYLAQDERQSSLRQLYADEVETPFYLYWSPEGQRLGFLANHAEAGIGLQVIEPGTGERQLLETGAPVYWQWAADTPRVLVHGGEAEAESGRLDYIDVTTGAREPLASQAPAGFRAPGISSSGRFVSYGRLDRSDQAEIVIRDERAASDAPFTIDHRGQAAMVWSPRTEQLAFVSPRQLSETFAGPLRLFDAETQTVRNLVDDSVLAFFWSPDGRWIAYFTLERTRDMGGSRALTALGTRGSTRFGSARAPIAYPQQPGELQMALSVIEVERSGRGPRELTRFRPSRTFALQVLPFFDQYALSHQLWSPGSDALVLPVLEDKGAVIQVVPRDGSPIRQVAEGSIAFWSPR